MSMPLILVAQGLLAQPPQALAAASSLGRFASLAPPPRVEPQGIAAALVDALDRTAQAPVAPLAALGAGIEPGDDYMAVADPVFLAADRDDVVLMERIDDLAPGDAHALADVLNTHFADDDLAFVLARADAWFVRCACTPDVVTTPFDAVHGRGIFTRLPRGTDAARWRGWQNEIQMLLHDHPVNAAREAVGKVPVTGVWFWGGGSLGAAGSLPVVAATAGTGRLGDLLRGVALHGGGTHEPRTDDDTSSRVVACATARAGARAALAVVDTGAIDDQGELAIFETRWLAPALAGLARHQVDSLQLIADGNGVAARWTAPVSTFWRRIAASAQPKAFVVPGARG